MADATKGKDIVVNDALERQWIFQALMSQRQMLIRSRQKEHVGSEVYLFRGKEIEFLSSLMRRFE